ncbi:MAG: flagellar biosynthetic protein FliR [Gammaproteobacteria bacterium]|nr:MAG: flagellar biosynthetic protein FliR [Gammaproteobacteria bacterium]
MHFSDAQLQQWLADFFWPFVRIGAALAAAPIFSVRQVPMRYRVLMAVLITLVIQPLIPPVPVVDVFGAEGVMIALQQIGIGAMMGFVLQLAFNALIFGGQVMAYSMGLGFASMMDPINGVQVPMVSQYWLILAMLAFLLGNGHLLLLGSVAESFHLLPVAVDGLTRAGLWGVVSWSSRLFAAGVLMALPVIIALLLINIGMGVVSRAAPQLNIFAIGFPITLLAGFLVMWVTLPQVMHGFGQLVDEALGLGADLLRAR